MPRTIADLRALVRDLPEPDADAIAAARARDGELTKPPGSLGRLEDIAVWMAGWQAPRPPRAENVSVLIFAGNHGVAARGVSAYPATVTAQMVGNFANGGAAINQICRAVGAKLDVQPLSLDQPTADFTVAPAMDEAEVVDAFSTGLGKVEPQADLICVGEMGIGNTTAAAALCQAVFGDIDGGWVGPGTGVDAAGLERKEQALTAAAATHGTALRDGVEAMRRVGGRELAAVAGAVIGARRARIPVLLDGFVACAAVAPLHALNPLALDHCLAAHCSAEPGHRRLLEKLGKAPLLDLDLRLGEGSGAALAVALVKAALAVHTGMATFAEAGVSDA
ncbi:MAG: nicotinate-nucleotide--dimethylbenzimidazole phosphoribosyltransferase [Alphaproteobacteria bacterium]|jgi:nicotinate-nucleotide--dimethylbenzimidazole phosphoribosyltransferase|nr:nicotinate-nucleotide--dimethylbenzimidazole phosphoribosyltransferase [Alphaproteobacteria bacterium]MDP6516004.1 nicotinate-nucleotide--dimethylbenzimidazole phosphoribosyltransferase [Alphaproteobacteria bacterium]